MRAAYASAVVASLPTGTKENLLCKGAIEVDEEDGPLLVPRLTRPGMDLLAHLSRTESFVVRTPSRQSLVDTYERLVAQRPFKEAITITISAAAPSDAAPRRRCRRT